MSFAIWKTIFSKKCVRAADVFIAFMKEIGNSCFVMSLELLVAEKKLIDFNAISNLIYSILLTEAGTHLYVSCARANRIGISS